MAFVSIVLFVFLIMALWALRNINEHCDELEAEIVALEADNAALGGLSFGEFDAIAVNEKMAQHLNNQPRAARNER